MTMDDIEYQLKAMGWTSVGYHTGWKSYTRDKQYIDLKGVFGETYFDLWRVCGEFIVSITVYKISAVAVASIKLDAAAAKLIESAAPAQVKSPGPGRKPGMRRKGK